MKPLDHLKQLAVRSYSWISQDPDGRGSRCLAGWNEEIIQDIEKIKSLGANDEQVERYKKGYEKYLSAWYHSQSNCASSFVCGPANFPVNKHWKRHNWADNHYNTFRQFREKVLKAYERYNRKAKIEEGGGELAIAKKKLENLEATQAYMKKVNEAHKRYLKNPHSLDASDLSEAAKKAIIQFVPEYSWIKHPFAPYQLTNNNAMIRNTKKRIEELEAKESASIEGNKELTFSEGVVIINTELDRLQIKHDQRPGPEVITELKKNGFKWSPFYKVWQRKLTPNATRAASNLLKIEI